MHNNPRVLLRWGVEICVFVQICLLLVGCNEENRPVCPEDAPPENCGVSCAGGEPCGSGLYCSSRGICSADCSTDRHCPTDHRCNDFGLCVRREDHADGDLSDAESCDVVHLEAHLIKPTIVLLIDQSVSMSGDFGDSTRWLTLRDVLNATGTGLINNHESSVRFGAVFFSAISENGGDGGPPVGHCPMVDVVPPALENASSISEAYHGKEPIEDTPLADTIDDTVSTLFPDPIADDQRVLFILTTYGTPDQCSELDPQNGGDEAIEAAERAFNHGIRTRIILMTTGDAPDYTQGFANAGVGQSSGNSPYDIVETQEELALAMDELIENELTCQVALGGRLLTTAGCPGQVLLDGRELTCGGGDGWIVIDETRIELRGEACAELRRAPESTIETIFSCENAIRDEEQEP